MSIQALAWAIEQAIVGEAKLVLIAMANHADHTTGRCYFDPVTIAREATVTEASLPRYVGALRRNGYLARDEKGKEREYWILFDREAGQGWSWSAADHAGAAEAVESDDKVAPPDAPTAFRPARRAEVREKVSPAGEAAAPQRVFVIEGSEAWKAWIAYRQARGVRPPTLPIGHGVVDGQQRRGWYLPSLFPPRDDEQISA